MYDGGAGSYGRYLIGLLYITMVTSVDGTALRERVRALFVNCLEDERRGRLLETCTFNVITEEASARLIPKFWTNVTYKKLYTNKARSLLFNLKNPATPGLKKDLQMVDEAHVVREFRRFVRMTHQEMNPAVWRPVLMEIERKNRRAAGSDVSVDHIGLYQCARCKSWRTDFTLLQTRSSDEPTTAFCFCSNCGKRWKMNA